MNFFKLTIKVGIFFFCVPLWAAPLQIFFDFSENPSVKLIEVAPSEKAKMIAAVFPSYIEGSEDCPTETVKKNVNQVFGSSVIKARLANGSGNQLLMALNYRNCEEYFGSHSEFALGFFIDGKFKSKLLGYGDKIMHVFQADANGLEQVLVTARWAGQGYDVTNAETVGFRNGNLMLTHYVAGTVARSNCGAGDEQAKTEEVSVFFVQNTSPLKLLRKNYSKSCGSTRDKFKYLSNSPLTGY